MIIDSNHGTDRRGVSLVGLRVSELGWLFREQQVSDVGIDAHLEVVDDSADGTPARNATGRLLAVQIKSGPSFFRYPTDTGWWFYCKTPHVDYWRGHSLPVVIALVDLRTQLVYWQHVNETTLVRTREHWKVHVPAAQTLDPTSAHILGLPARTAPDRDPFQTALDALPGEARDNLLRAHADDRPHALPLATHLAHAPTPENVVTRLLDDPPHWMPPAGHPDAPAATSTIMAYAVAHRLGPTALRTIETAADAAGQPARAARLRALGAALAIEHAPHRVDELLHAAREHSPVLASVVRSLADANGHHPTRLPAPVQTALDTHDPAVFGDATVLAFISQAKGAAGHHDQAEAFMERALALAPTDPDLQTNLAETLLRRNARGAPRQSLLDGHRAHHLTLAARAEIRRWAGPSGRAAYILLHARNTNHDTDGALRTAIAQPAGEALPHELEHPALRMDAARLAYRSGRPELARELEQGIDDEGLRAQLAAIALEADASTDHQARVLAWTTAAEAAQDDEQRVTAAMELATLGIWPLPDLTRLRDLGHVPPMTYDIHHAAALTAQGDTTAAIRVLRRWENNGAAAALALTDTYARAHMWPEAARACERAGIRFGDINQRLAAVELWRRADDPVQARLQALTLLSRPLLSVRARRHLRHEVLAWAREREDWVDTEDHAWAGIWEESGVHDLDDTPPTPLPPRAAAFAWVAIHAQINARRLDAAQDTHRRFRPPIENPDQARMWLRLKAETGWDTTAAEQGLDLADRFRTDTRLSEEIAGALLGATAGPADTNSTERPERLDLTEDQVARFRALVDRASPHNPVFRRIPATSDELVHLVRTTLGPRQGTIAAAEDGVRIGAIPMAVLAERAERPVGLAYALRAGGLIPAATHEPQLLACEFTAARTALDGTVILDTSTAIVANLIPERFDQLRAQFADVLIATPCHDDLVKTRVGLDELLRTSGQLGLHDGHVVMTHVRDEDKRALRERRADLINAIPTLNPHDIRDDHTLLARLNEHGYTTLDNPPWLAGAQLALDKTAPLWCDDAAMRRLLHEIDIPTFGTMALLHVLTHDEQRNDFTLERARQDIRVLLREHVVDLPLSSDDILWAADNDQWKPGGATTAVFATPGRWGHDGEDLWLAFVEHAWAKAPHTLGDWYRTAAHGYTALARPDRLADALARLAALTILAAGAGPEPVHALDTVAQATLTTCAEALEARLAGLEEAVEPRSTADPGDWRRTTKATLVSLLVDHRGFAPATARAIVAQAFEG